MSVYDNMAFGLKMRKFDKKIIDEKVRSAARVLNLENLLERKPRQLSGGQRQRVALGRAIVRNPKVFLMDEPLSNLDANLRVQMRAEIKRLHQNLKTTFVYVTHDQTEALTMGDRIVVLDKGVIQQAASPEEIYNNPKNKFVAGFIGQMNFIDVSVNKGTFVIEGQSFYSSVLNNVNDAVVGIRAEKMVSGDTEVSVTPEIIEMSGGERNIYFTLNSCRCSARLPFEYDVNGTVRLKLSVNDMYFFNKVDGERIL